MDTSLAAQAPAVINQCDGCQIKAPLTERGNHKYPDGSTSGCTKDRYKGCLLHWDYCKKPTYRGKDGKLHCEECDPPNKEDK